MKPRIHIYDIRYMVALFIISCMLFILPLGCNHAPAQPEQPSQPAPTPVPTSPEPIPAQTPTEPALPQETEQPTGAPRPPIEAQLTLSHAPKVGETTEAVFTILPNLPSGATPRNVRAWLEFSWINTSGSHRESKEQIEIASEEVLVEGDLDWEGILSPNIPLEFRTDIRFLVEGIWEITGYFNDIDAGFYNIQSNQVKLAVETERAGIYGSDAYRAGELEWMKDYSPTREYIPDIPNSEHPVIANLDLSKPPKLGETAELIWSITSIKDFENVDVWIELRLLEVGSSQAITPAAESILIEGNLQYEGAITKGVPVSSSAIVKFPNEGDWEITLRFLDPKGSFNAGNSVFLNVTKELGKWGWAKSYEDIYRSNFPPKEELPRAVEPAPEGRR